MNYINTVDEIVKKHFKILEPNYPDWLNEYINTKEMLDQRYISITCGTIYSDLFESDFFFSSLDHSIAVALIIWRFTYDKKPDKAYYINNSTKIRYINPLVNGKIITEINKHVKELISNMI